MLLLSVALLAPMVLSVVACGSAPVCSPADLDVLSCSAASETIDACCVNSPGGLLLLTQFYDWNPSLGPEDSWTIHGLWPDYCNGSYPASCDDARNYTNITAVLESYGETSLLEYMDTFWKNDPRVTGAEGDDAELWAHEWGKHGTCMSTLSPSCYASYTPALEAVDFLNQVVDMFRQLPTFDHLSSCGISPTNSTTYALADVEACLMKATGGFLPHVGCDGEYLSEVWYYYHVAGRIRGGRYEATNTTYASNCPSAGIRYPPKL